MAQAFHDKGIEVGSKNKSIGTFKDITSNFKVQDQVNFMDSADDSSSGDSDNSLEGSDSEGSDSEGSDSKGCDSSTEEDACNSDGMLVCSGYHSEGDTFNDNKTKEGKEQTFSLFEELNKETLEQEQEEERKIEKKIGRAKDFVSWKLAQAFATSVHELMSKKIHHARFNIIVCGIGKNLPGFFLLLETTYKYFCAKECVVNFLVFEKNIERIREAEHHPNDQDFAKHVHYCYVDLIFDTAIVNSAWESEPFDLLVTFCRNMSSIFYHKLAMLTLASSVTHMIVPSKISGTFHLFEQRSQFVKIRATNNQPQHHRDLDVISLIGYVLFVSMCLALLSHILIDIFSTGIRKKSLILPFYDW